MAEKSYNLKVTESELRNPVIKKHLVKVMEQRIKAVKHKPYLIISTAEYKVIKLHWSWTNVEAYAPDKKDRLKGEVGKYQGKRVRLRGGK